MENKLKSNSAPSFSGYAKKIQKDLLENPLSPEEEYTSWDVTAFYDNLDCEFFIECLRMLWSDFQEKSTRNISFKALNEAIKVCYEDGVHFDDTIYRMKNGGLKGQPVISCHAELVQLAEWCTGGVPIFCTGGGPN